MGDYVFISHSNADKALADATCARLESAGIRCWIAPRDITPGRNWSEAIIDGINASRLMILIFSRQSNKSPQVSREIERAVNRGLPLLQVRVEDIKPSRALELFISSSQWLDAFPPPAERHLDGLPAAVERLLAESVSTEEREAQSDRPRIQPKTRSAVRPRASRRAVQGAAALVLGAAVVVLAVNARQWLRPGTTSSPPANVLRIGSTPPTREVGDTFALQATLVGSSGGARSDVRWRSSDNAVVRINAGDSVFRAIAPGTAVLYAEGGGARDSVQMRVQAAPPPPSATIAGRKVDSDSGGTGRGAKSKAGVVRAPSTPTPTFPKVQPTQNQVAATGAKLVAVADLCVDALRKKDQAWLANHYGEAETRPDKDNMARLSDLVRKKGYAAELLAKPQLTDGVAEFKMEFEYSGAFGPRLKTTGDFLVRAVDGAATRDQASCRVKGMLRVP